MGAGHAVLDPPHMQDGAVEVDLVPAQIAGLGAERVNDFETPFVMRLASKRV